MRMCTHGATEPCGVVSVSPPERAICCGNNIGLVACSRQHGNRHDKESGRGRCGVMCTGFTIKYLFTGFAGVHSLHKCCNAGKLLAGVDPA